MGKNKPHASGEISFDTPAGRGTVKGSASSESMEYAIRRLAKALIKVEGQNSGSQSGQIKSNQRRR